MPRLVLVVKIVYLTNCTVALQNMARYDTICSENSTAIKKFLALQNRNKLIQNVLANKSLKNQKRKTKIIVQI